MKSKKQRHLGTRWFFSRSRHKVRWRPDDRLGQKALEYCIDCGTLPDFLMTYRLEIAGVLLEEFDVEKYERTIKKEGYEEGHASGLQEGRASDVLTILEQKGTIPADLRERILSKKDETVLKRWLLAAASAEDIETFREKIGIS